MPPRERSRCSYSGPDESVVRMPRLEHLPQVLPLSDPRLPLALPAGGGGARVATLAL